MRFIAASTPPKASARPSSRRVRPFSRGGQISASTTAAASTRMKTVPPEPISSNSDLARAAPTCTEAIAASTSRTGGTAGIMPTWP